MTGRVDMSIIGQKFGKLTVLDLDHVEKPGRSYWLCECECGTLRVFRRSDLISGKFTHCGKCRTYKYDLVGQQFGHLTVLEFDHHIPYKDSYWLCECDCGNTKVVSQHSLLDGSTKSCGCMAHPRRLNELTGQRFGRWVVLEFDHYAVSNGEPYWLCECDCGTVRAVSRSSLVYGKSTSCGCYNRESLMRHGGSYSRLYRIWRGMFKRCERQTNDNYDRYGGRGIAVCPEWRDFSNFQEWALENGYSDDLTIDREDNDLGYFPENCRWVDSIAQGNNRSTNHLITYNGITHTIAEWSRLLNINYRTLYARLQRGDMRDFEDYFEEY